MLRIGLLLCSLAAATTSSHAPMSPGCLPSIPGQEVRSSVNRACSVLELAKMMVPLRTETASFSTREIATGLSRVPGKGLSEAVLPLDRAVANHLVVKEGYAKAHKVPSTNASLPSKEAELHAEGDAGGGDKNNDRLYYRVYGNGPQKVLMVMGLSASCAGWEYLLPFLAGNGSEYQVAVFDNRGIGKSLSPNDTEHYSMPIFAADTIAVADELGWDKFHLVGFSMGGMISQVTAALYPHRLVSLALLSTTARRSIQERIPPISELPSLLNWVIARTEADKAEADLRMHFDDDYLAREFVSGATIKDFWKSVYLSERAEKSQGQGWGGFSGQLSALTKFKLSREDIERLRVGLSQTPVLIMSGTKDRIVHPDSGSLLHGYLTRSTLQLASTALPLSLDRCRLVRLEAGHFLPIQKRREVASSLLSLWHQACPDHQDPQDPLPQAKRQVRLLDAFASVSRMATKAPKLLYSLSKLASQRTASAIKESNYYKPSLLFAPGLDSFSSPDELEEEAERVAIANELTCKFGEADHEIGQLRFPPTSRSQEALEMLDLRGDWGPDDQEEEEALWMRAKERFSREHEEDECDAKGWSDVEEGDLDRPSPSSLWYH